MAIRTRDGRLHFREFSRMLLEIVRRSDYPMTSAEVARAIMRRLGHATNDRTLVLDVAQRIDRYLRRKEPDLVQRRLYGPLALGWVMAEKPYDREHRHEQRQRQADDRRDGESEHRLGADRQA